MAASKRCLGSPRARLPSQSRSARFFLGLHFLQREQPWPVWTEEMSNKCGRTWVTPYRELSRRLVEVNLPDLGARQERRPQDSTRNMVPAGVGEVRPRPVAPDRAADGQPGRRVHGFGVHQVVAGQRRGPASCFSSRGARIVPPCRSPRPSRACARCRTSAPVPAANGFGVHLHGVVHDGHAAVRMPGHVEDGLQARQFRVGRPAPARACLQKGASAPTPSSRHAGRRT